MLNGKHCGFTLKLNIDLLSWISFSLSLLRFIPVNLYSVHVINVAKKNFEFQTWIEINMWKRDRNHTTRRKAKHFQFFFTLFEQNFFSYSCNFPVRFTLCLSLYCTHSMQSVNFSFSFYFAISLQCTHDPFNRVVNCEHIEL